MTGRCLHPQPFSEITRNISHKDLHLTYVSLRTQRSQSVDFSSDLFCRRKEYVAGAGQTVHTAQVRRVENRLLHVGLQESRSSF